MGLGDYLGPQQLGAQGVVYQIWQTLSKSVCVCALLVSGQKWKTATPDQQISSGTEKCLFIKPICLLFLESTGRAETFLFREVMLTVTV